MSHKTWNEYQNAIFATAPAGGSYAIHGVAGCGKTSTIEEFARRIGQKGKYLVFNRANAEEAKKRLPEEIEPSTFHSFGLKALRKTAKVGKANGYKYVNLAQALGGPFEENAFALAHLSELARNFALSPNASDGEVYSILNTYDWRGSPDALDDGTIPDMLRTLLSKGLEALKRDRALDFTDMLWAPIQLNAPFDRHGLVLVDEAQDTNPIQASILSRMLGPGSRLYAVGDPNQAIYGFRGASNSAMADLTARFGLTALPLSVSYRVPLLQAELAREFVPRFETPPNAPDGVVNHLSADAWKLEDIKPGHLVISRYNKPLLVLARQLLLAHIPFTLAKTDLETSLRSLAARAMGGKNAKDLDRFAHRTRGDFISRLDAYVTREREALLRRDLITSAGNLAENAECLDLLSADLPTIGELSKLLSRLFAPGYGATLSSIHRAKGAEAETVWYINRYAACPWPQRHEWETQQDANATYVGLTRSLDTLNFIDIETQGEKLPKPYTAPKAELQLSDFF